MKRLVVFYVTLLVLVVGTTVLLYRMASATETSYSLFWLVPAAFTVSLILTPAAGRLARRLGAIDNPGGRKIHDEPTPLLGGLAIYIAFAACTAAASLASAELAAVFTAATIIFVIGFIEDTRGVAAIVRLAVQAGAVAILIRAGVVLTFLPHTWWGMAGEWILTFLWIVGITNAFNYLDGLDGLASGSAAINGFFLGVYGYVTDQSSLAFFSFVIMAAALGFLPYNYKPFREKNADIFLGDSGSTFLGFTLASLAVMGDWAETSPKDIIVPVLIMAVPVFDMTLTTVIRIRDGLAKNFTEWIVYTGKDHFHHRLLSLGIREKEAVAIIFLVNLCLGISAFLLKGSNTLDAFLVLGQVTIIFGIIGYAMVVMKKRRGSTQPRDRRWDDSPTGEQSTSKSSGQKPEDSN